MARPIVLSNGQMHVGINLYGEVHDFYFPYVGLENHAAAQHQRHKIGVWVENEFSWLDDGSWQFTFEYPYHALIGRTKAHNAHLGIILEFDSAVDAYKNVFLRNIHVINQRGVAREIRVFLHQVFNISNSAGNGDTAQYLPDSHAILTYKGHRAFVVGGVHAGGAPFDQYSIGLFGIEGREGTYRDAEDGYLSGNNVEHGRVDSVLGFTLNLKAHSSGRIHYWIAAGRSSREALDLDKQVREEGLLKCLLATHAWWQQWLKPADSFAAKLDKKYHPSFINNILLIKSHIDNRGAVIASTDTTMLNYARDAYAYCWPRDAAYALWPLIRMGYQDEPLAYFELCRRELHSAGYLMHKYQADGALGSSWHPYEHDGVAAPPIQEDETAISLFMAAEYYRIHKDPKFLEEFYNSLVAPMADFLVGYIDEKTGLPKPSYNIWEEKFFTTTYTTATVYGALLAATELAEANDDAGNAVRWRTAADDIAHATKKYLYNSQQEAFYNGFYRRGNDLLYDETTDISSVFGAFNFGLLAENQELKNSFKNLAKTFAIDGDSFKLPRYEGDNYNRRASSGQGNPWFVSALWLAQYYLANNHAPKAQKIIDWARGCMLKTGVLPEQIDRQTNEFISVAPLTWSQAEYVSTLLDLIEAKKA